MEDDLPKSRKIQGDIRKRTWKGGMRTEELGITYNNTFNLICVTFGICREVVL